MRTRTPTTHSKFLISMSPAYSHVTYSRLPLQRGCAYHYTIFRYTPLWNPSHWRVELRCLHIRKHAQGDPTAVRDIAWSLLPESNRQPTHYRCVALPIELRRRLKNQSTYWVCMFHQDPHLLIFLSWLHPVRRYTISSVPHDLMQITWAFLNLGWLIFTLSE